MFNRTISTILLFLSLIGCSSAEQPQANWVSINGRTNSAVYQIKVPKHWKHLEPPQFQTDTRMPIAEFSIGSDIKITIHNFPSHSLEQRIPPQAQAARWERQFEKLDTASVSITPQAFSGFSGLLFEASGILQGSEQSVMAWAMQIAPQLYQRTNSPDERADFTIKVQGSPQSIKKYRTEIVQFARSFELINSFEITP